MFEVGFQELVLIALLALIVLGPEKLPKMAAKLGQWTGRARSMARNLRQQLENEVSYEDLMRQKEAAEAALKQATEAPMEFHHDLNKQVAETLADAGVERAAVTNPAPASLSPTDTDTTPPTTAKDTGSPA